MTDEHNICRRGLREHAEALQQGEYTAQELTECYLRQIEKEESRIHAFLYVDAEGARASAKASDIRRERGECLGIFDGIPFAVKDNFCTAGIPTTCASLILKDYIPDYTAEAVKRLTDAGAVLLGKLNLDEFAMGSATLYSAYGVTKNPYDLTRVPGGSSGGSAAAVAAHEVPFALGSDTGGSVRQPAAFCGVYGLRPTYGAISRYGMIAFSSSMDAVGILAGSAEDCALVLKEISGKDKKDATSFSLPEIAAPIASKRFTVGVIRELNDPEKISPGVQSAMEAAAQRLSSMGAEILTFDLPQPEAALAAYSVITSSEAASNLARFDGVRYGARSLDASDLSSLYANTRAEGFGDEVKRRILFGTYVQSGEGQALYYCPALRVRDAVRVQMDEIMQKCDLLLTPTAPSPAPRSNAVPTDEEMHLFDLCTVYESLAGYPAISVPFGKSAKGMPLAVQFAMAPKKDHTLLRFAAEFAMRGENADE